MFDLQSFRTPGVASFLAGQFVALFSGLFGLSVLSWFIVQKFGAAGIAQFYAVQAAVACLSYVLLSPIGDRYNKLKLIQSTSWLIAFRSILLAGVAAFPNVSLATIIALQAINAIAMSIIVPARAAFLPELVPANELQPALGIQHSISSVARTLGPACAGLALIEFSPAACLAVHAAMTVIVCVLNLFMPRVESAVTKAKQGRQIATWCNDILDSWRIRLQIPIERYLSLLSMASLIAFLPAITMLVPLRIQSEGWGTQIFGITEACISAGALLAGLGRITQTTRKLSRFGLFMCGCISQGVFLLVASVTTMPLIFAAAYFFFGFCGTTSGLVLSAQRTLAIPKNFRARLTSSGMTLAMIAGSIGSSLCGFALEHLQLVTVNIGVSAFILLAAVAYCAIPRFREFLNLPPEHAEQWYEGEFLSRSRRTAEAA